jgi:hypothetical protein
MISLYNHFVITLVDILYNRFALPNPAFPAAAPPGPAPAPPHNPSHGSGGGGHSDIPAAGIPVLK